ncbi:lanthionine synthetase C family protein [Longispora sp. K20-0274]|uniref:lanthionine synthetase C family protein n=1 Tax=Longispora sp. K20-0274 TaxID=3088255 RepID=UPI00399AE07C
MSLLADTPVLHEAAKLAASISEALTEPPPRDFASDDRSPRSIRWNAQSIARGAAGVVILHGVRAQTGHGDWRPVRAWLRRMTADPIAARGHGVGLWFGAPALAHTLSVALPGMLPRHQAELDRAVARLAGIKLDAAFARIAVRSRPRLDEFDLVRGLSGIGAHLLRHQPDGDLLVRVLGYLVQLTEPVDADDPAGRLAPGWWSNQSPDGEGPVRGGHANLGAAHGIAGPLSVLATAYRHGVTVPGHTEAIERICDWLDRWRQLGTAGPWWPQKITLAELRAGEPALGGPLRPSWCYGTPGLARAQQLAGIALKDPGRQQAAEDALTRCLADRDQLAQIVDPSLCHGWAGLAATLWYAALDARSTALPRHLSPVLQQLLHHAAEAPERVGLIEGRAGVALTLHAMATGTDIRWATSLMID